MESSPEPEPETIQGCPGIGEAARESRIDALTSCTRKVRGSGMEALPGCNRSSGESMLIDPLGVDDI